MVVNIEVVIFIISVIEKFLIGLVFIVKRIKFVIKVVIFVLRIVENVLLYF